MGKAGNAVNALKTIRLRKKESGIALLIAIFVLLLVCVVGIAMVAASGTESALTGNYHSETTVYYAALAGLEEGRGRLSPKNPNYINNTVPGFLPSPGTPLPLGKVLYIENPWPGETVNPTGTPSTYQDTEYDTEFGAGALAGASISTTASVSTVAGIQGPMFKWVRINAITENAIHIDVNHDGVFDSTTPLYYDDNNSTLTLNVTNYQALEITSLAAYPNGGQKILQYVAVPTTLNLNFPGALTLVGSSSNDVYFTGPGTSTFYVNGNDQYPISDNSPPSGGVTVGGCAATSPQRPAIAYVGGDNDDITTSPAANYLGFGSSPSVQSGSLPANLSTPALMEANLVQTVWQNADTILTPSTPPPPFPTYTYSNLPTSTMSATNPMTIVVNGDLDLTSWHGTGYGLLLVTGTLTYDPDATWYGIVLVIGQGKFVSTRGGVGQFNGEMLIAKTRDSSDNILSSFGQASFSQTGGSPSGYGIYYSSCYDKFAQPSTPYQVLSFHEIPE
jgi:hypothetical protein